MSISNLKAKAETEKISRAEANLNLALLFFGLLTVTFGLAYLLNNIGILELDFSWRQIWPMIVILVGFSFFPKNGWLAKAIGIIIMTFSSAIIIILVFNGTKARFNWEDVSKPYQIITQGQSKVIAESWIQHNSPTYTFDGVNLEFDREELIEECFYCYRFTYLFSSRHPDYGNRKGKLLLQELTPHTIEVEVRRGIVTKAITDHTFDELNSALLVGKVNENVNKITGQETASSTNEKEKNEKFQDTILDLQ